MRARICHPVNVVVSSRIWWRRRRWMTIFPASDWQWLLKNMSPLPVGPTLHAALSYHLFTSTHINACKEDNMKIRCKKVKEPSHDHEPRPHFSHPCLSLYCQHEPGIIVLIVTRVLLVLQKNLIISFQLNLCFCL